MLEPSQWALDDCRVQVLLSSEWQHFIWFKCQSLVQGYLPNKRVVDEHESRRRVFPMTHNVSAAQLEDNGL